MRRPLLAALSVVVLVGACGTVRESRLNPFNWFGGSTEATMTPAPQSGDAQDRRPLVEQVTGLVVEAIPGGAIVRATGLPPTQGYWSGKLVEDKVASTPQNLVFRFVLLPPPAQSPVSTVASREVRVATYLSDIRLAQLRQVTVTAANNARSSRR